MKINDVVREIAIGQHVVECVDVQSGKPSKSGAPCKVFKFVVIGDNDKSLGTFIYDRFYIQQSGLFFLGKMLQHLGVDGDMEFNENGSAEYYFNQCAGKRTKIDVHEDSYNGNISKKIKTYLMMSVNDREKLVDTPRVAPSEYVAPPPVETSESGGGYGGGNYGSGDDIPF